MTSIEAELRELRRRRRTRRIVVAVACVTVLILGAVWLNSRKPKMTCAEWQVAYSYSVGRHQNLDQVRPDGCQIPSVS